MLNPAQEREVLEAIPVITEDIIDRPINCGTVFLYIDRIQVSKDIEETPGDYYTAPTATITEKRIEVCQFGVLDCYLDEIELSPEQQAKIEKQMEDNLQ